MSLFKILLAIHIVCGGASLLLGAYILAVKKGSRRHRLFGSVYFYAMLLAAIMALLMSCIHPNYFLFIIGVLTAYLLLSGRRYIHKKAGQGPSIYDWSLTVIILLFGLALILLGVYNIIGSNLFGIVFVVFGSGAIFFAYQDWQHFRGKAKIKNYYLTTHLQRMTGSYIAALTAFLVVNNKILPGILAWLLPSLVLVPVIIRLTIKYKVDKHSADTLV